MILRSIVVAILACAFSMAPLWGVEAQNVFERMVLPGPLIEGHAKLEKECTNCHEAFARAGQTRLCLDCHKDIAADRQQNSRFHGRRPDAAKAECKTCHTEHKGRSADIVQLDRQTFNHAFTRFELKSAHTSARCEGCHLPGVKFRNAPAACNDCHKQVDPHRGRLGEKCDGCHSEDAWRRTKPFDHGKTRFALIGAHTKVACAICHVGERYKDLPRDCATCHAIQDVHGGRYGARCETCHQSQTWKSVRFDHARQTKFPLQGNHAKAKCDTCHTGDLYRDKLSTACVGCHKKDDPHKGQMGTRCAQCHNESGWRQKVAFDHDLTRFPLIGRHAAAPCEECHRTPSFKDAQRSCASCHKDTYHAGRLGADCARCHNPNGWPRWRFDHNRQTRFALTGAHDGLQCHACHREKVTGKISLGSTCHDCHANDDAHRGSFGRACEKCHSTTTFRQSAGPR